MEICTSKVFYKIFQQINQMTIEEDKIKNNILPYKLLQKLNLWNIWCHMVLTEYCKEVNLTIPEARKLALPKFIKYCIKFATNTEEYHKTFLNKIKILL